jgi:uncharacterized membrane protein (DUF485 family)
MLEYYSTLSTLAFELMNYPQFSGSQIFEIIADLSVVLMGVLIIAIYLTKSKTFHFHSEALEELRDYIANDRSYPTKKHDE